jgi:glycosyltransferase involved in cell wall biosynthesis
VPADADLLHLFDVPVDSRKFTEGVRTPYVLTLEGFGSRYQELDPNTIFVSRKHAERFGSDCFVYNGLDWDEYGKPDLDARRTYVHFLGDAGWKVKNIRGAIRVAREAGETLYVLGGHRLNFRMGFRLTISPWVRFKGWVGGEEKLRLLAGSKALVFPVKWHEPFGLAITESLFFGCPVFGTPYGSLPEIVTPEVGHLSARTDDLASALRESGRYDRRRCHQYAADLFGSRPMALAYLKKYETVLAGRPLNPVAPRRRADDQKMLPFD